MKALGDRRHVCQAEGCDTPVLPRFLMCPRHWHMVPPMIQRLIARWYHPDQGNGKMPSGKWLQAVRIAIDYVAETEGRHG